MNEMKPCPVIEHIAAPVNGLIDSLCNACPYRRADKRGEVPMPMMEKAFGGIGAFPPRTDAWVKLYKLNPASPLIAMPMEMEKELERVRKDLDRYREWVVKVKKWYREMCQAMDITPVDIVDRNVTCPAGPPLKPRPS